MQLVHSEPSVGTLHSANYARLNDLSKNDVTLVFLEKIASSMVFIEIVGFIGTGLVIWAYVPQIHHLIKEHCSAGISLRAYVLWFIAAILLLVHAIMIQDATFIFLQTVNTSLTLIVLVFAKKYRNGICPAHKMGMNPF
jgi:uncharacterized protein with PQ loop repeat